jgi:hypothetical protein
MAVVLGRLNTLDYQISQSVAAAELREAATGRERPVVDEHGLWVKLRLAVGMTQGAA